MRQGLNTDSEESVGSRTESSLESHRSVVGLRLRKRNMPPVTQLCPEVALPPDEGAPYGRTVDGAPLTKKGKRIGRPPKRTYAAIAHVVTAVKAQEEEEREEMEEGTAVEKKRVGRKAGKSQIREVKLAKNRVRAQVIEQAVRRLQKDGREALMEGKRVTRSLAKIKAASAIAGPAWAPRTLTSAEQSATLMFLKAGLSIFNICKGIGVDPSVYYRTRAEVESFNSAVVSLGSIRADSLAEEALNLVDSADDEGITREQIELLKLRTGARKWMAGQLSPKKWGNIKDTGSNTPSVSINIGIPGASPVIATAVTEVDPEMIVDATDQATSCTEKSPKQG